MKDLGILLVGFQ